MAFDSLSERLQKAMKKITGRGKLHESDIDEMLREVRLSLLEADVNFRVVKKFLAEVKSKALGAKKLDGLNPGQQVVDIVREELKQVLGSEQVELNLNKNGLTVLMLVGLQGAGKTTACGKIALYLRKKYKKTPLLIAADVYRPAAIDQLVTLGKQINVPVYEDGIKTNPRKIVKDGINQAIKQSCDLVIIDTAGRLQVNEELMDELKDIKEIARPHEILLTVDAMSGQDACNVATAFNEKIDLTGIILTKLDGDARGGAALSIKEITGLPIKLMSTGEKLDELEIFYPDRIADRILGMGDVLTLIDTVKENIDESEMEDMADKMLNGSYNYNDLVKQFKMIKRMGSLSKVLGFLPGLGKIKQAVSQVDDKAFVYMEAIISSMTEKERRNPKLIEESAKRRERIAKGSGRSITEVNNLRNSLNSMRQAMKKFNNMSDTDKQKMSSQVANGNYSGLAQGQKVKKGKGKGKGAFRF